MFGTAFLMVLLLLMHLTHVDTVRIPETRRSHLSYRNDIRRIGPVNIRAVCILPSFRSVLVRNVDFARFPSLVSFNIGGVSVRFIADPSFLPASCFHSSFIHSYSMKTLYMRTVIFIFVTNRPILCVHTQRLDLTLLPSKFRRNICKSLTHPPKQQQQQRPIHHPNSRLITDPFHDIRSYLYNMCC
jgi:hypothetical protein